MLYNNIYLFMNKLIFLVFFLLILLLLLNNTKQLNKIHQNTLNVEHELFQGYGSRGRSRSMAQKPQRSYSKKQFSTSRPSTRPTYSPPAWSGTRPDRPDRPGNPDRPDRPGNPDRPDRPDRPGNPDRPDKKYYHFNPTYAHYGHYPHYLPISRIPYYPVSPPTTVVVNPEYSPSVIATERLYSNNNEVQVGTISNLQDQLIMPLFKKPSLTNRDRYNYYTITNGSNGINPMSLPVYKNERSCMESIGCSELFDNDIVFIPQYNRFFRVNIF